MGAAGAALAIVKSTNSSLITARALIFAKDLEGTERELLAVITAGPAVRGEENFWFQST